ncbi:DUF3383 family protein [Pectobacterium carotovorum]
MAIDIGHYVKITSGVGGGNNVRARDLILRIFTPNILVSPDSIMEFTDSDSVGAYFGTASEEYRRAVKYFNYISPLIVQPSKLSFARDQNATNAPLTLGAKAVYQIANLQQASGVVSGDVDGVAFTTGSVNLSSVATLAAAATALQTALRAVADVTVFAAVTVTYDATQSRFIVTGGTAEAVAITFDTGAVSDALGLSNGEVIRGVAAALTESESVAAAADISNNYGTFLFTRDLELNDLVTLAEANAEKNVMYMLLARTTENTAASISAALLSVASVSLTLVSAANSDYDDQIPGTLMAATNYSVRNGVINYMYKQLPGVSPKVTTTQKATQFDALRVNYYGRTQTAGQVIDFFQRGVLMGGSTAPVDMNVHANEQWLKDQCAIAVLTLQLSIGRIPANISGRSQILTTLQTPVDSALLNGVISVGKTLNTTQKLYITQMTGDDTAWHQVQNIGYWLDAVMSQVEMPDGRIEWQCVYSLIYSKDDSIRRVLGTHVLI